MSAKDDYDFEMKRRNYTRAAMIAEESGFDQEKVDQARHLAFKGAVGEWFNFRGAEQIAREWGFDAATVAELCEEVIVGLKERLEREGRELQVFDVDRMDHTSAITLVSSFRSRYR